MLAFVIPGIPKKFPIQQKTQDSNRNPAPSTMRYFPTLALSKSGCGLKHLLTLSPPARAPHSIRGFLEPPSIITSPSDNASFSGIFALFFFRYGALLCQSHYFFALLGTNLQDKRHSPLHRRLLMLMRILLLRCHPSADMALRFVDINYFTCLRRKRWIHLL